MPGHNPATWMLEVTSSAEESRLGLDFAEVYRRSNLYQYVAKKFLSVALVFFLLILVPFTDGFIFP